MSSHLINFMHLRKAELEYEVIIRGGEKGTVIELRKQIIKLSKHYDSEDILISGMDEMDDLNNASQTITDYKNYLPTVNSDRTLRVAISNRNHIFYRLGRISPTTQEATKLKKELESLFNNLETQLKTLQSKFSPGVPDGAASSQQVEASAANSTNITVTCPSHQGNKPKFDGNSCVRAFIQKL